MSLSPLEALWHDAALAPQALARLTLRGGDPVLPSSFAVGLAAQTSIALAALAAAEIGLQRCGVSRRVEVAARDATVECTARALPLQILDMASGALLGSVRHAARFVPALAHALLPSMPPGTHPLAWPISAR